MPPGVHRPPAQRDISFCAADLQLRTPPCAFSHCAQGSNYVRAVGIAAPAPCSPPLYAYTNTSRTRPSQPSPTRPLEEDERPGRDKNGGPSTRPPPPATATTTTYFHACGSEMGAGRQRVPLLTLKVRLSQLSLVFPGPGHLMTDAYPPTKSSMVGRMRCVELPGTVRRKKDRTSGVADGAEAQGAICDEQRRMGKEKRNVHRRMLEAMKRPRGPISTRVVTPRSLHSQYTRAGDIARWRTRRLQASSTDDGLMDTGRAALDRTHTNRKFDGGTDDAGRAIGHDGTSQ
ncbi:hypothetical protein EVG20_g10129 [Dentipellis fragilis]|uniref:Uncharacterized protein n=1 Tax=Dentipellis fragilis TaxID=205917 RepID=A0A4Y9XXV4_9AGAM|nr:hypothetical protein EVG20_g10129 [Dentipellis fragilis]